MLPTTGSSLLGFGTNALGETGKNPALGDAFKSTADLTAFSLYGIIGTYLLWKASHMAGALTGSLAVAFSMGHHGMDTAHVDTKKTDTSKSSSGSGATEDNKKNKTNERKKR